MVSVYHLKVDRHSFARVKNRAQIYLLRSVGPFETRLLAERAAGALVADPDVMRVEIEESIHTTKEERLRRVSDAAEACVRELMANWAKGDVPPLLWRSRV